MKIMKTIPIAAILLLLSIVHLQAQGVDDAMINSQILYEGTSRSIAMGNATGAMGGDVTAICINPAGLGLYRTSEFTFTTGIQRSLATTRYYEGLSTLGTTRMSIPNFGYVLAMECSNYKPLRYLQFSIGLTRTNDFNYQSQAKGMNPSSSLIDSYLQTINGIDELFDGSTDPGSYLHDYYPYNIHPAWQTYLIDQYDDSLGIYYDSPVPQGHVCQNNVVSSTGRSEEWTTALAANIKDKWYFGASIGLKHIKRRMTRTYSETPENPESSQNSFQYWSFEETLKDDAWGANMKIGLIYAPIHSVRLGASCHTRTFFDFEESWSTLTKSTLPGTYYDRDYLYYSPNLNYTFELLTPATYTASAAFLFGQRGMITADIDYLNFKKAKLNSDEYSYADTNDDIKDILGRSFNIRIGTEWRMYQYYLRGGAAYYGSPFGFGNRYGSVKKLGIGIGYVTDGGAYWDFAYELSQSTTAFTPYQVYVDDVNIVEDAIQYLWRNKVTATLKLKL